MTDRKTKLEQMLIEQPDDEFLRYALAMELAKEGSVQKSLDLYADLMRQQQPYVAAFFMAGQLLAKQGDHERAIETLESGIEQATEQGDMHAAGEMREFVATIKMG